MKQPRFWRGGDWTGYTDSETALSATIWKEQLRVPMTWFWWISAAFVGLIWVWHTIEGGLGMRHVARVDRPEWDLRPAIPVSVAIIVPARNEAHTIEPALRSLVALDYPNVEVIVVNDRSTDATAEIMERVAMESNGLTRVIHIENLPAGWLGKTHAMWRAARETTAEFLLFTDADIEFRPDTLRRVMSYVEREKADHVVVFPTMIFKTFGERLVMAFFAIMFGFAHRPWKVADPKTNDHIGMGAFNLVRRSVYEAIGTYQRMRLAVIDDIRIGELVKHSGYAQRAVLGRNLIRVHWAPGALGILHNLTKNFFAQMRFSSFFVAVGTTLLLFVNLMPFIGIALAPVWAKAPFAAALLSIALLYISLHRDEPEAPAWLFVLHPLASFLMAYAVLRSAFVTLRDGGITWRGTKYSLDELRQGMR